MQNRNQQEPTGVFNGSQLLVICGDVSDADCDRAMKADAAHCGNPLHRRLRDRPIGPPRSIRESKFNRRHRQPNKPRTALYESDVEWLAESVVFDASTFDPDAVRVVPRVQRAFSSFHRCSAKDAIEGVRLVMAQATQAGRVRRLSNDSYQFFWRGFSVKVSRDLTHAYRYQTSHQEQTPQLVLAKAPSRFSGARNTLRQQEKVERVRELMDSGVLTVGDDVEGTVASITNFGVFVDTGQCGLLVHRSEIPAGESVDLRERFRIGDPLRVKIISVDADAGRIAGSMIGLRVEPDHSCGQHEPAVQQADCRAADRPSLLNRIGLGRRRRTPAGSIP